MLKVLEIALAELGYQELNGGFTKYAAYLDSIPNFYNGKKNGYAWCDIFVDYCFAKAYGAETAKKMLFQPDNSAGAGCTFSAQYYKAKGRFSSVPQIGAQIFFGSERESNHTGLVYDMDGETVYTVEGNTADMVAKRQYSRGDNSIYGYGLPDYSLATEEVGSEEANGIEPVTQCKTADCTVSLPQLKKGSVCESVRAMQTLLLLRGCDVGLDGADGDFGDNTLSAVKAFQSKNGLEIDGIVGRMTWAALIA